MKHPMQKIVMVSNVHRFVQNSIVRHLLEVSTNLGFGLNELAIVDFSQDDWEQFYQLIGYSLSGYSELSKVSEESYLMAEALSQSDEPAETIQLRVLSDRMRDLKEALRGPIAELYGIHPDDLNGE